MTEMTKAQIESYLKGLVGPRGTPESMTVELNAVRRMALAVENFDPIHFNDQAAKERGYRGIVAPWPFLWLLFFNCSEVEFNYPFGKATVHGDDKYEFHEPIIVGDEIFVHTSAVSTGVKEGKAGLLGLLVDERRFINQRGELCAVLSTTLIRR